MDIFQYLVGVRLKTALRVSLIAHFASNAETNDGLPNSAPRNTDSRPKTHVLLTHAVTAWPDDYRH